MKVDTIQIVLVLYKSALDESLTFRSLIENIQFLHVGYELLIYNNSPEIQIAQSEVYQLKNATANTYLAGAYNYALSQARQAGHRWLLLLDQDTELTKDYFQELDRFLQSGLDPETMAIVPVLKRGDICLSPKRIDDRKWKHYDVRAGRYYQGENIIAYNSLTLLSVDFMEEAGGFSSEYPLDMLDYSYFRRIYLRKGKIYVLPCEIEHNLSHSDYEKNVSIERHSSYLSAEKGFVYKELGRRYVCSYKWSLLKRYIKQLFCFKNKTYAKITLWKLLFR